MQLACGVGLVGLVLGIVLQQTLEACGAAATSYIQEVVSRGCVELGVDTAGKSLQEQAAACWASLGAPASRAWAVARARARSAQLDNGARVRAGAGRAPPRLP